MPLPNPSSYQNKDEYISACMSKQKGESKDNDQKLAICFSQWRKKNESNIIQKINSLIGDETTTSGIATNTACGHIGVVSRQERKRKRKQYHMGESAKSPKPGDRFEYKGKKLTIKRVGSGLRQWHDEYITVSFDGEKNDRDIKIKDFFKGNDFKYINEANKYVYVIHKRKNKEMKIPDDPEVIKKYKARGFELKEADFGKFYDKRKKQGATWHELKCKKCKNEWTSTDKKSKCPACGSLSESIFGATVTGTEIAGSGQTRAVGSYNQEVMNLKRPVKFSKLMGTFVPADGVDADGISVNLQKEPPPPIEVVEKISYVLKEEVRWKYKDDRGVWQTGTVYKVGDYGGTDIVYQFKNDKTGKIDVVSGSRLKDAKPLYGKPKDLKKK